MVIIRRANQKKEEKKTSEKYGKPAESIREKENKDEQMNNDS